MPHKLLLADDSITIQKVVEIILAQEDFEIRSVGDGEEALKALPAFRPDVVLADVAMPLIDGYQLCEKIRGNPAFAHVPVVMLAGAFEPYDEARANAAGARGVLVKPFESKELIGKIKSVIGPSTDLPLAVTAVPAGETDLSDRPASHVPETDVVGPIRADEAAREESRTLSAEEAVRAFQTAASAAAVVPDLAEFRDNVLVTDVPADAGEPAVAGTGSAEEPGTVIAGEKHPAPGDMPDRQEIAGIIEKAVDRRLKEAIESQVLPDVVSALKESLIGELSARVPSMLEGLSRELLSELSAALRPEIEQRMNKAVPEIAEALIRKEIEKITSEG